MLLGRTEQQSLSCSLGNRRLDLLFQKARDFDERLEWGMELIGLKHMNSMRQVWHLAYHRSPKKLREGYLSIQCVSVCPQEGPIWPLPMLHWTSLYRALPSPPYVQRPPPPTPTLAPSRHRTLLYSPLPPANDIWWPSLETCSNLFTSGPPSHQCWYLVAIEVCMVGASGQNAFLLMFYSRFGHLKLYSLVV